MAMPTGVSQVVGVGVIAKSMYGLEANIVNAYKAAVDKDPYSKGSLATDIADAAAPGNINAQRGAMVFDLAADLATGRYSSFAATDLAGKDVLDANGFTNYGLQYGYWADPANLGKTADAFILASLFNTANEGFGEDLFSFVSKPKSNCP
jgi:hypothetical protein